MENQQTASSGAYKIERIVLMQSEFTREVTIDFSKQLKLTFDHQFESFEASEGGKFGVSLKFTFKGMQDQNIAFTAIVQMTGIFEKIGEPAVPEDSFKKVNAPAIIYPFIREHIHALCQKGAIGDVLLPTVNFKI